MKLWRFSGVYLIATGIIHKRLLKANQSRDERFSFQQSFLFQCPATAKNAEC